MTNLTERKAGMAKGKYAARAATARAENAADHTGNCTIYGKPL